MRRVRHLFDALISRARFERDLRDEIRLHIDERARDLVASGIAPPEAARQARVEFGAVERYKEQCRDARGFAAMRPFHGFTTDVRLAARRLASTPQFLIFAALSLAVGIAVTTAMYSVLASLIGRPIAVADPSRTVVLQPAGASGLIRTTLSDLDFRDLRAAQRTMSAVAGSVVIGQPLAAPAVTEFVEAEAVTGDYFGVVGRAPVLGRMLDVNDETTAASVIVLSERTWRTRFDADRSIVGRTIHFGGQPFEVVGVAGADFNGIYQSMTRIAAWVPLSRAATLPTGSRISSPPPPNPRAATRLSVIGRLAPGHSPQDAAADVAEIGRRLDAEIPITRRTPQGETYTSARHWSATAMDQMKNSSEQRMAMIVVLLAALVLAVACTNLANLMLARGAMRQQEFAVRRALGASRWRLVRELCAEGGLVALAGGVCGLLLLSVLLRAATVDMPTPRGVFTLEPHLNLAALAVASLAALLSLLVFGFEPAMQLTRSNVIADFSGGAVGLPRSRRQRAFIRWQVAVSVVFFLAAAILVKVLVADAGRETGVDMDRLGIATVHFIPPQWDEERARHVLAAAATDLRAQPGVESVALSSGVPFGMTMSSWAVITAPGLPLGKNASREIGLTLAVTPEYFATLGIRLVRGRFIEARDDAAAPRVMIASERTARARFGTSDAIGRQLSVRMWGRDPAETYTIVGIASDTDTGRVMTRDGDVVYVPFAQHFEPNVAVVVRTSGDTWRAARLVQGALRRADPDAGTGTLGPASMMMAGELVAARVAASIASSLGLLTLLMAMVGLYGIQSHIVARRTREVGVRMAIGATAARIERMMLGEGYRPVLEGLGLGLLLGLFVRLLLRALVNGSIDPFDAVSFALVPIPLIAAAFVACYLPARRAARVDPNEALRHL
jgi:predicted permease